MTTSNEVITKVMDSVMFVPLEAIHANDSLTYVYSRQGKKQIVVLGESNENNIIVEMGLEKGQKLYLSQPSNTESFEYAGLELLEEINRRKEEAIRQREKDQKPKTPKGPSGPPSGIKRSQG